MTIETKMSELLKGVVQDAALTTEMLENIKQLIADNESLEKVNKDLNYDNNKLSMALKSATDKASVLLSQNDVFMEREEQLQKREIKADLLFQDTIHQQQRVEDHKEMVALIFRNTRHMESVLRNDSTYIPPYTDQYNTNMGGVIDRRTVADTKETEEK